MNVESTLAAGTGFAVVGAVAVEVEVVVDVEVVVLVGGVGLDVGGAVALPEPELQAASATTTDANPAVRILRTRRKCAAATGRGQTSGARGRTLDPGPMWVGSGLVGAHP